jgi:hypothetical protein
MIDNAGIRAACKAWQAQNPNNPHTDREVLSMMNAFAIIRDGKIVTERPRVYAREQRAIYRQKPYSILLNGLHVDLKICIEWPKSQYATTININGFREHVKDEFGELVTETSLEKSHIYPGAFDPVIVTESSWPTVKLKTPIVYPNICDIQALGFYQLDEWAKQYSAIIPEQDQLELVEKRKALQAEHARLVPIQTALAMTKKVGNAKTKLTNKRIQKLAGNYRMKQWAELGAPIVHELMVAFTKWQPRDYPIMTSPIEHFGFALTLGTETAQRIHTLYCGAPESVAMLFDWVQEQRRSGTFDMTLEDVQEAFDLYAVKGVIES